METKHYFASIVPTLDKEIPYVCFFVDIQDVFTQGDDIVDAVEMIEDALRIWAEDYTPNTKTLPTPSTLEEVKKGTMEVIKNEIDNLDETRDIVYQLVKLPSMETKPVRIQVSLPFNVLEQIDKKAQALGMTRSGLLANSAMAYQV